MVDDRWRMEDGWMDIQIMDGGWMEGGWCKKEGKKKFISEVLSC